MFRWNALWILVCLTFLLVPSAFAEESNSTPIGRRVEEFAIKDYRGKQVALVDFAEEKLLVVAFLGTECPLAKLYAPRLASLAKEYEAHEVAFLGINANRQDSLTEIAAHARRHGIEFPVLKDLGNKVADQMGAVRTPEVFVLDEERAIRYWGRIDDQYGIGYLRDEPNKEELRSALDQLLAGRPVETPQTKSVGCYIGRVRDVEPESEVTYSNQIARIIQKRCVECHREGEIAPFALTDYDEVAGWADTINEVVRDERMPPWHASEKYGQFSNDRRMTADEKALIRAWVKAGAPEGDPKQLSKPREFVSGWQLPREPDDVVDMRGKPYQVPAEGVVRYQYFKAEVEFKEDKWVTMAEAVPGNRAVVHHILVFVRPPGDAEVGAGGGEFLAAYVPGMRARVYPQGMAKLIPAGSEMIFQMHYTPIGTAQEDLSQIGLVYAEPDEVTHIIQTTKSAQSELNIKPRERDQEVIGKARRHNREVELLAMMPHMHLRGQSFRYEVTWPGGDSDILLNVPNYDFNWQTSYRMKEPLTLPVGTRIQAIAQFDNSEENLANPDPNATVHWGDQTWNEMMIGYYDVAIPLKSLRSSEGKRLDPRIQKILNDLDENADGELAREEVPKRYRFLFNRLDADKNDSLTVEELERLKEISE